MGFRKKKGEVGEVNQYVTQNRACKMLQLTLPEFRKLCIWKGIYPREPKSRQKAQRGDSKIKTLYLKRDIVYISHEPLIWKIREAKIHRRKVKTLDTKGFTRELSFKKALQNPTYKFDRIVLERYPTFDKAVQDLDDALSAMFLYASLPNYNKVDLELVHLCRKLTTEFLNYVIESRSLTKTFICIRGYFYRAHIMGERITWMIPHPFPPQGSEDVEIRIVKTFVEFYCTSLGFINFKLYNSLNLYYPPKLVTKIEPHARTNRQESILNVIQSLNTKLQRNCIEDDEEEEEYDQALIAKKFNKKKLKIAEEEREKIKKQQNLFNNLKFFLGRETNRESLTLVIRSAGGLVSWDESLSPGYSFPQDDTTINYEIVDRPTVKKEHLSRYYLQPQWVYDSFNAGVLLPVQLYFVGVELPAHLSPFEEAYHKLYNPPEMERLRAFQNKIELVGDKTIEELKQDIELNDEEEEEEEEEEIEEDEEEVIEEKDEDGNEGKAEENEMEGKEEEDKIKEEEYKNRGKDEEMETVEQNEGESEPDPLAKMSVRRGRPRRVNVEFQQRMKEREDFRLAASFIHRKQKRFFKKVLTKEIKSKRYTTSLKKKRIIFEQEMQKRRQTAMKETKNKK